MTHNNLYIIIFSCLSFFQDNINVHGVGSTIFFKRRRRGNVQMVLVKKEGGRYETKEN